MDSYSLYCSPIRQVVTATVVPGKADLPAGATLTDEPNKLYAYRGEYFTPKRFGGTLFTPDAPVSGDIVHCATDDYYSEHGKTGKVGRIREGLYGPKSLAVGLAVSVHMFPGDPRSVSMSGGPLPAVDISQLEYVGRGYARFWTWGPRGRGPGNGTDYFELRPVWSWTGQDSTRVPASADDKLFYVMQNMPGCLPDSSGAWFAVESAAQTEYERLTFECAGDGSMYVADLLEVPIVEALESNGHSRVTLVARSAQDIADLLNEQGE